MKQKNNKKLLILAALFLLASAGFLSVNHALAGSASLTWNANTEADLAGYKIYYGTSPRTCSNPGLNGSTMCGYTSSLNVNKVTTYNLTNLTDGQTYYFSVSAYDTANNYSAFSEEKSKAIAAVNPAAPACTSFTYSGWSACQTNSTQSRTIVSSLPSGCSGGSPVLSQTCSYTPTPTPGSASSDNIPPAQPRQYAAVTADGKQISLKWINPTDQDFVSVLIVRKENSQPTSRTDGKVVYEGIEQNFTDTNFDSSKTYYYSIYAYDKKPNYSAPLAVKVQAKLSAVSAPAASATPASAPAAPSAEFANFIKAQKKLLAKLDDALAKRLKGKILLQAESKGEAWYLDPISLGRFYLSDGARAYGALCKFGLGITNKDLAKIPVGIEKRFLDTDTDGDGLADKLEESLDTNINKIDTDGDGHNNLIEVSSGYNPAGAGKLALDSKLSARLKGRIVLQTESRGQAWYINPTDGKRYYLKDGNAAYQIMKFLSLGITNENIRKIKIGN